MIVVSVRKDGIEINGHAGYAEHGKDIVCAGVTALFQTLVKSIRDLTSDRISVNIAPGASSVTFGNLSEEGRLLIDSFFIGICQIANEFSAYVRIV